jgi:hypothetical protein
MHGHDQRSTMTTFVNYKKDKCPLNDFFPSFPVYFTGKSGRSRFNQNPVKVIYAVFQVHVLHHQ